MQKFGAIVCTTIFLAGCAQVYDPSALPSATAANNLAMDMCNAKMRSGEITTYAGLTECYLAADRKTVAEIKLARMDIFEAYAARARILALDTDAGRLPAGAFQASLDNLQRDFAQSVNLAYATEQARQQRVSQGLAAMGSSMQQAGAAYQANTPPALTPPPLPRQPCMTMPTNPGGTILTGSYSNCP